MIDNTRPAPRRYKLDRGRTTANAFAGRTDTAASSGERCQKTTTAVQLLMVLMMGTSVVIDVTVTAEMPGSSFAAATEAIFNDTILVREYRGMAAGSVGMRAGATAVRVYVHLVAHDRATGLGLVQATPLEQTGQGNVNFLMHLQNKNGIGNMLVTERVGWFHKHKRINSFIMGRPLPNNINTYTR